MMLNKIIKQLITCCIRVKTKLIWFQSSFEIFSQFVNFTAKNPPPKKKGGAALKKGNKITASTLYGVRLLMSSQQPKRMVI